MQNNDFEEARTASEEMMENNEQLSLADVPVTENIPEETPEGAQGNENQIPQNNEQSMLGNAVQTAEVAAQTAAQKDSELQQVMQELEAMRVQNTQLQSTIEELSRRNEEQILEEALEPPVLDINSLAFADEATVKAAQAKYAADMAEYNRKTFMKELEPFIQQAKEGIYEKEKNETVSALKNIPELKDLEYMMPQIENIISNNKWLSSENIPLEDKIISAYAIARGVNAINTPPPQPQKEPTVDELMAMYNSNSAFQEMVERQRIEKIKQGQQVPQFSASTGASNAALNIMEKPKSFDEILERLKGE